MHLFDRKSKFLLKRFLPPLLIVILCGVLLSHPIISLADDSQQASRLSRPKIGLVLGGGGARGAAHVGVLKVLEQLHIPIDYIAGNSMGAIIGGLYASGFTPEEIEHELQTIPWDEVFNDAPPRPDRPFRRKRDDDIYTVKAQLGYSDGEVKLPLAYIHGQQFGLQLSRLTLRAAHVRDFNKLPIPFRAVATDIETGKEVVLQSGNLAQAIRASMAVPGAFDPVEIDNRLLVDGLVANNVPVNVVRAMGADVVIVVDVGAGLRKRGQIKTALNVVEQLSNILSQRNVEQQLATLKSSDILIRPDLKGVGAGDFSKAEVAIANGEQAARQHLHDLERLSISTAEYNRFQATRQVRATAPVVDFVRIDNPTRISSEAIRARITLAPGQLLDTAKLDSEISAVYGMGVFETVTYEVKDEEGKTGVVVHVKEKSWGPNYLQFGLKLSDNFQGDSAYNLGVLYTRTAINELNGELRFGLQIGQDTAAFGEWYQPLDPASRYFINAKAYTQRNKVGIYNGDDLISEYNVRSTGLDLGLGREFGSWGEGRLGYRRGHGQTELLVGTPAIDSRDFQVGQAYVRFFADTLDRLSFPTTGSKGIIELSASRKALGADSEYSQAQFLYSAAVSSGRNHFLGEIRFNTTLGGDGSLESRFREGGFLRLSGFQPNQLSGQHSGVAAVTYYRRFTDLKILPAYIGTSLEYGNVWQEKRDISLGGGLLNGSIFLGSDTPIGPLYVGLGFGEGGKRTGFLYLGSPY